MKLVIRFMLCVLFSFSLWGQSTGNNDFYFSSPADEIRDLIEKARETDKSDPAEKLRLAGKAYELASSINLRESMTDARVSMGVAFYLMHDYEKSLDILNTSYKEAVKFNFTDVRFYSAFNLGILFDLMNDRNKAYTYFDECRNIVGDEQTSRHAEVLKEIADLYRKQKKYDDAEKIIDKALKIATTAKDNNLTAELSVLSGQIRLESGDIGKAVTELLHFVDTESGNSESNSILIKAMSLLAQGYALSGNYTIALSYGQDSLLLAGKIENGDGKLQAYYALSFIYEKKGDYKKAYEYLNLFYQQKDILEQERSETNINSIRSYYEASETEKEIGKQQQQIQNQNKIIVAGTLILILLAGFLIVFYRLYRKNSKIAVKLSRDLKREMVLSKTDPLTGLPNRKDMEDRISKAIALWKINGRNFSLLFLSFEELKKLEHNGIPGTGEKIQKHIAEALRTCLKGQDIVGVWKPYLFTILLPDTEEEGLLSVRNLIGRKLMDYSFSDRDEKITLSFRAGFCTYAGEGNHFDCVNRCREQIRTARI